MTAAERRALLELAALHLMNDNTATDAVLAELRARGRSMVVVRAPNDEVRVMNRLAQAAAAIDKGDYEGSLKHWARVVFLQPNVAKHRFFFGAALWQAVPSRRFDDAIEQLQEACRLDPSWDQPFVELAIIDLNRGRFESALYHLDKDPQGFATTSGRYNFVRGRALHSLRRFEEGLAAFDRAIELRCSDLADAHAWAADCAFEVARTVKDRAHRVIGARHAKAAYDLGRAWICQKWHVT